MSSVKSINESYESVGIDALKPHPKNPRQGDVGAIHHSIEVNGFYGAVVAQKTTGFILAGNHRWKAAREAGMTTVPVIWVDVDDDQALKILLADNRTNDLAAYNNEALAEILAGLANSVGLEGTGYDGDDLDHLISGLSAPKFEPVSEEDQARLDERKSITCPECGHEFTA